jgi:hypothetical protein
MVKTHQINGIGERQRLSRKYGISCQACDCARPSGNCSREISNHGRGSPGPESGNPPVESELQAGLRFDAPEHLAMQG